MDRADITSFVERSVDNEQSFPVREFLIKLYVRRWTFAVCVLITMVPSLAVAVLTPTTWIATTEILIRYSSAESPFLQGLIPDNRSALSGPVISEILRSLPTLAETISRYGIQKTDLYQTPTRVVLGKLMSLLPLPETQADPASPGVDPKAIALARLFQDSLQESSRSSSNALSGMGQPVELLGKDSPVPQSQRGDELITLSVRSFNRLKVAEMTNGLAQTCIDRYYDISAEDARRSYEFLSSLVDRVEANVHTLEQDPDASVSAPAIGALIAPGASTVARDSPQIARLTNDLAALQTELGRQQQFYYDGSRRIEQTQAEIASLKRLLEGQERLEEAKSVLQQIRARRFQALNTESLYRNRLVPISIVEPAVTPAPSLSSRITRIAVAGITGALIGLTLGLAFVVVFGLLEQRLFTPVDTERALRLPVFGSLPKFRLRRGNAAALPEEHRLASLDAGAGLMQILSHLDAAGIGRQSNVVAVASAGNNDGKSLVSLLLARAVARAAGSKVLLIDADPLRASLSGYFQRGQAAGPVDPAVTNGPLVDLVVRSALPNLDWVPAETLAKHLNTGFYLGRFRSLLNEARSSYDLVIVDTPSCGTGGGALMCCMAVDNVLIVVRSGVSRKFQVSGLLRSLQELAVRPQGVILNFRHSVIPRFIDQSA